MDLEPQSSITRLLKSALHRVDGMALYLCIIVVIVVAIGVVLKNLILGTHATSAWLLPKVAIFAVPILILTYFNFAMYTSPNDNFKRVVNALLLVGLTGYFIIKFI